jgi:hypothetical protein
VSRRWCDGVEGWWRVELNVPVLRCSTCHRQWSRRCSDTGDPFWPSPKMGRQRGGRASNGVSGGWWSSTKAHFGHEEEELGSGMDAVEDDTAVVLPHETNRNLKPLLKTVEIIVSGLANRTIRFCRDR